MLQFEEHGLHKALLVDSLSTYFGAISPNLSHFLPHHFPLSLSPSSSSILSLGFQIQSLFSYGRGFLFKGYVCSISTVLGLVRPQDLKSFPKKLVYKRLQFPFDSFCNLPCFISMQKNILDITSKILTLFPISATSSDMLQEHQHFGLL